MKLKLCECGGKGVITDAITDNDIMYYVYCSKRIKCGSKTKLFITESEAITAWNKRTNKRRVYE